MYAVIKTGGKQYKVAAGEKLKIEQIPADIGSDITLDQVLAVGEGKRTDDGKVHPVAVKVGDRVIFGKYSGQTVKVDGSELLVMREDDIMAVVQK